MLSCFLSSVSHYLLTTLRVNAATSLSRSDAYFDAIHYSLLSLSRVVKLCPRWVAPNLLTLVGFICCVGHNALTAVYDYNYDANCLPREDHDPIPGFVWFFVAVLLFLSHTLDGIDGKQGQCNLVSI